MVVLHHDIESGAIVSNLWVSSRAQRALLDRLRCLMRSPAVPIGSNPSALRTLLQLSWYLEAFPALRLDSLDASIAVLGERCGVLDVLTLDHRHFDSMRGPRRQTLSSSPRVLSPEIRERNGLGHQIAS